MTCVILEKKSCLNNEINFSDISTKFMKSHIDRKFTCFTFVGSGKRKKWMVGKRLKKGEFVSNGFPLIDCIFADQNLFTCSHDIGYIVDL